MARKPKAFAPIVRGENKLSVRNDGKEAPEIVLIGSVGKSWWSDDGITEKEFRDSLKTVPKGSPFTLRINSEGGSVQEGLGIYNAIKERRDDATAIVSGYALSIASVFPLAAAKVVSPKSAIWMMHKAWSFAQGNSDDMEHTAEMLKQHDETLAEIYAAETGRPIQEMRDAMEAETWVRGSEAVAFGLADESDDDEDDSQAAYRPLGNEFVSRCKNLSGVILNMVAPTQTISPANDGAGQAGSTPAASSVVPNNKTPMQTDNPTAAGTPPAASNPVNENVIIELKAQLHAEKIARIRGEVIRRGENKIANDRIDKWVERAMSDETVLAEIDAMPVAFEAGKPIRNTSPITITAEGGLDKIRNEHKTPAARSNAMVLNWNDLIVDAAKRDVRAGLVKDELFCQLAMAGINPFSLGSKIQLPQNSNTITSVLTNFLMDGSVTDLQNRWAMLKAFSLDTRPDGYKPLAPGVLKHVTVGSTAQTNATNYESGDSTVAPVTITPAEHSISYQISNTDLNSGVRMQDLVTINTAKFANIVIEAATAPITVANFAGPLYVGGPATKVSSAVAFSFSDLADLQGALKKSPIKNLILDGSYIARIANSPAFFQTAGVVGGNTGAWRAFGWDLIAQNTDWTGAGANVQGFACNPQAIGGIIGLPLLPAIIPGNILSSSVMTVDGLDIQVLAEAWFNPATRTSWNSLRVMDGWSKVDGTAGFLVTSA